MGLYYKPSILWHVPDGTMSCDEIRFWLNECVHRHHWPKVLFGRVLGCKNPRKCNINEMMTGRTWIYRMQQVRFTRALKRILSGELVPIPPGKAGRGCAARAVLATNPKPLVPPNRFVYDRRTGKLKLVPWGFESPLPSFQKLFPPEVER